MAKYLTTILQPLIDKSTHKLKKSEHNHSMSNFGLFFWAEFLHVVSNLIQNHSPVFFSLVCA